VTLQREKEFTQDVSHELRTPLMALGSSLELLESKISDPSQLDKVNGMRRSLDRMN
jgi:signal transduction histidine kinase